MQNILHELITQTLTEEQIQRLITKKVLKKDNVTGYIWCINVETKCNRIESEKILMTQFGIRYLSDRLLENEIVITFDYFYAKSDEQYCEQRLIEDFEHVLKYFAMADLDFDNDEGLYATLILDDYTKHCVEELLVAIAQL